MTKEDEAFIYSSWLKSFRASKVNIGLPQGNYYERQSRCIDTILAREETHVAIASDITDDAHVFGYVVFEIGKDSSVIHYLYVKQAFRRLGIGAALLNEVKTLQQDKLYASHFPANEELHGTFKQHGIEYDPDTVGGPK